MRRLGGVPVLLAAALAASSVPSWGLGRGDAGTSGAAFLKIAPGARPAGLGEAFGGVADDVHAVHYNPAGLAALERVEVAAMHESRFQGLSYEFGALAVPLLALRDTKERRNARGVVALSLSNLSVSGIERRGLVESDAPVDTFGSSDFAYTLAYGLALDRGVSVGAAVKYVDLNLDSSHASAFALDAGGLWKRGRLSLGAGARNLGTKPRFQAEADPLPASLYGAAGFRPRKDWLAAVELSLPRDDSPAVALGAEYSREVSDRLTGSLRGGFNTGHRDPGGLSGASLGAGVRGGSLSFDFAWEPFGELGDSFRYSLAVRF